MRAWSKALQPNRVPQKANPYRCQKMFIWRTKLNESKSIYAVNEAACGSSQKMWIQQLRVKRHMQKKMYCWGFATKTFGQWNSRYRGKCLIWSPLLIMTAKWGTVLTFLGHAYSMKSFEAYTSLTRLSKTRILIKPSLVKSKDRESRWPLLVTSEFHHVSVKIHRLYSIYEGMLHSLFPYR